MKLSKAQQAVMDGAKADIDFARTHTLREWATKECYSKGSMEFLIKNYYRYGFQTEDEMRQSINERIESHMNTYHKYYENERNGIVLTQCNSRTLAKLEQLGLIEIIYDSNGSSFGIDTIKVLNY